MSNRATTNPDVAQLRALLKTEQYNAAKVSVSGKSCGTSRSLTVTIRHPDVDYWTVKAMASTSRRVDICQASNDILEGGNSYVSVEIAPDVAELWTAVYLSEVCHTLIKLQPDDSLTIPKGRFMLRMTEHGRIDVYDQQERRYLTMQYDARNPQRIALDIYHEVCRIPTKNQDEETSEEHNEET